MGQQYLDRVPGECAADDEGRYWTVAFARVRDARHLRWVRYDPARLLVEEQLPCRGVPPVPPGEVERVGRWARLARDEWRVPSSLLCWDDLVRVQERRASRVASRLDYLAAQRDVPGLRRMAQRLRDRWAVVDDYAECTRRLPDLALAKALFALSEAADLYCEAVEARLSGYVQVAQYYEADADVCLRRARHV